MIIMDKVNYDSMLVAFNNVLDGLPEDTSDLVIEDINTLKSIFIDYYGVADGDE